MLQVIKYIVGLLLAVGITGFNVYKCVKDGSDYQKVLSAIAGAGASIYILGQIVAVIRDF